MAKPLFLKDKLGTSVRLSAPVVVVERIIDTVAVLLLGAWGLISVPYGWLIIPFVLVGMAAFLAFLASKNGVGLLVRLPVLRRWGTGLTDSSRNLRTLLSPKVMTGHGFRSPSTKFQGTSQTTTDSAERCCSKKESTRSLAPSILSEAVWYFAARGKERMEPSWSRRVKASGRSVRLG